MLEMFRRENETVIHESLDIMADTITAWSCSLSKIKTWFRGDKKDMKYGL